jgi:hypothetical protein
MENWKLHMHQSKLVISLFILLVIGLHALPVLQRLQGERQTLWPFMAWGMYRTSRAPGPIRTTLRRVIAVTSTGQRSLVTPGLLGLSSYAFERMYLNAMVEGDPAAAQQLASRLNAMREDLYVELRLESETYSLTELGVVRDDTVALTYPVIKN